jgi:hypothetical protein
VKAGDLFHLSGGTENGTGLFGKANGGLMRVETAVSANEIDVSLNAQFTDFVADETGISLTLQFLPRGLNTNVTHLLTAF